MDTWRARWRSLRRHEHGGAVVEFALVVPIFFLFVWGAMSMSLAYQRLNILTLSLREGARFGATLNPGDPALVRARVDSVSSAAGFRIDPDSVGVQYFGSDSLTVGVTNYPLFLNLTGFAGLTSATRLTVFRLERP